MENETGKNCIIISPHFDDEIIGLYEVLMNPMIKPVIIYMQEDEERKKESLELRKHFNNINIQLFQKSVPSMFLNPDNIIYCPDPIYEIHPDHRKWGAFGEELFRQGLNVIFYSVNMNAPYIHQVKDPTGKRRLLEKVYPSQKSMWKYEHKYFIWEGRYRFLL